MDIHRADPRARRIAIALLIAGIIAGTALLLLFERARPHIAEWILADAEHAALRARMVLGAVALMVVAPLMGFAAYFYRLGVLTVRSARFPPPHTAMLHDTPVLTGDAAGARGRTLQALGLILIASAVGIVALLVLLALRVRTP